MPGKRNSKRGHRPQRYLSERRTLLDQLVDILRFMTGNKHMRYQ
jgi:hypothetical protein